MLLGQSIKGREIYCLDKNKCLLLRFCTDRPYTVWPNVNKKPVKIQIKKKKQKEGKT
jgi:hypothetical protein